MALLRFLKEHVLWKTWKYWPWMTIRYRRDLFLCFHFYFIDTSLLQNLSSSLELSATFPCYSEKARSTWNAPEPGLLLITDIWEKSKNVETLTFVLNRKGEILTGGTTSVFLHLFFLGTQENKSCICIESIRHKLKQSRGQFKNGCDIVNAFKTINICCSFDNEQLCTLKLCYYNCKTIPGHTHFRPQNTPSSLYNATLLFQGDFHSCNFLLEGYIYRSSNLCKGITFRFHSFKLLSSALCIQRKWRSRLTFLLRNKINPIRNLSSRGNNMDFFCQNFHHTVRYNVILMSRIFCVHPSTVMQLHSIFFKIFP